MLWRVLQKLDASEAFPMGSWKCESQSTSKAEPAELQGPVEQTGMSAETGTASMQYQNLQHKIPSKYKGVG